MISQFTQFLSISSPSYELPFLNTPSRTTEMARIFFLIANHQDLEQKKNNVAFITKHYSYKNGDILLVEDDEDYLDKELNLNQIEGIKVNPYTVKGWDPHSSCVKRRAIKEKLEKISLDLNTLKTSSPMEQKKEALKSLRCLANHVKIKAIHEIPVDDIEVLTNSIFEKNLATFITSCETYIENTLGYVALEHFPLRQKGLFENIHKNLKDDPLCKIYVLAGPLHVDTSDSQVGACVKQSLDSLNGIHYQIIGKSSFLASLFNSPYVK
jgi:hypothetical protein